MRLTKCVYALALTNCGGLLNYEVQLLRFLTKVVSYDLADSEMDKTS